MCSPFGLKLGPQTGPQTTQNGPKTMPEINPKIDSKNDAQMVPKRSQKRPVIGPRWKLFSDMVSDLAPRAPGDPLLMRSVSKRTLRKRKLHVFMCFRARTLRAHAKTMRFYKFSSIGAGSPSTDRDQKGQSRVRTEPNKDKAEYGQSPTGTKPSTDRAQKGQSRVRTEPERDKAEYGQSPTRTTPSA